MKTLEEVAALAASGNVIPLQREFFPDLDTPITALLKLKRPGSRTFLLESVELGEKLARYSFLGRNPIYTFQVKDKETIITGPNGFAHKKPVIEKPSSPPLTALREFMDRFRGVQDPDLPAFSGGAVGIFCYDSIRLAEDLPAQGRDDYGLPEVDLGVYESFVVFDHLRHRLRLVANVMVDEHPDLKTAYARAVSQLDALAEDLAAPLPIRPTAPSPASP
jgi:anthranilate synthase component 1